jgi:eukaryotic-like serine/threonine-protein kinase
MSPDNRKNGRTEDELLTDTETVTAIQTPTPPTPVSISRSGAILPEEGERYEQEQILGEGGMGRVLLCHDRQIGRRVAMKVIRPDRREAADVRQSFLREARLQGQLEHPSLVPVYDLGIRAGDDVFFTMRRVKGATLKEIITGLRDQPDRFEEKYSRRRLLSIFNSVCLAVDFAHSRGVLHRDLKPPNIMIGDFGEIYILDWGIARVMTDENPEVVSDPLPWKEDESGETISDSLDGTPGYMSPEHATGTQVSLSPTSDVYALGSILFQLLTLTKLHLGSSPMEILISTATGNVESPSQRAPDRDIPPELDDICNRATAKDPDKRYSSARQLSDAVERYLDGERDEELRTELAEKHAAAAAQAAPHLFNGRASPEERRAVMRDIGRALALDPTNVKALGLMVQILTRPPKELPKEVEEQLKRSDEKQIRWTGRVAGVAYLSLVLYLPLFMWTGVRNVPALAVFYGLVIACGCFSLLVSFLSRPRSAHVLVVMVLSTLAFGSTTSLFGPLVLMPALIAVNTGAFSIILKGWHRVFSIFFGCLVILVLVLGELAGNLYNGYLFNESGMVITPGAIELHRIPTILLLCVASLATVLTCALSVSRIRDALGQTERKLYLHTWHLRQLVPSGKHSNDPDALSL